jgi:hypothetical protein
MSVQEVVGNNQVGDFQVSTIRLPIPHDDGEYETMVFRHLPNGEREELNEYTRRCWCKSPTTPLDMHLEVFQRVWCRWKGIPDY